MRKKIKWFTTTSSHSCGFTLVELLVVVGIIGLLATILLANFNSARQRARDTQRLTDLKKIQTAIEVYKADNQQYPCFNAGDCAGLYGWAMTSGLPGFSPTYLQTIPQDPLVGSACPGYLYWHSGDRSQYILFAMLENANDPRATAVKSAPPLGAPPFGTCVSGCKSFKVNLGTCSGTTYNYWVLNQ